MEMLSPGAELIAKEAIRPLKRVEYDRLAAEGCFANEQVELLFGVVVEMTPMDRAHALSTYRVRRLLEAQLGDRAMVLEASPFAASDISEPEPDVLVTPNADDWQHHPTRAFLIVEVSRSSLGRDQGTKALLYGMSEVDEYWIINHRDGVIEVHRDRHEGAWRARSCHARGETIAMLAFPDVEIAVADVLPPAAG
jgi:Uma2 family endonuclease